MLSVLWQACHGIHTAQHHVPEFRRFHDCNGGCRAVDAPERILICCSPFAKIAARLVRFAICIWLDTLSSKIREHASRLFNGFCGHILSCAARATLVRIFQKITVARVRVAASGAR